MEFAKLLFCENGTPCGECTTCRSIDHGNHPGVTVYSPPQGKSAIDIDTVRELCERSHYARDHSFVAILNGADVLTIPAANALLKTLEEPNGDFILVLTATSAGALPETIVSRSHRLYFTSEHTASDESKVEPGLLTQPWESSFHSRTDVREWLSRAVLDGSSSRERVRELLAVWITRYRSQLEHSVGDHLDVCLGRLDHLLEYRTSLDGNVNPELVLEKALASLTS